MAPATDTSTVTEPATDNTLAALVAGFALGLGFLTVWEAVKQTQRNQNPWKSMYIMMIWGEIGSNIGIAVLGWLLVAGVIPASVLWLFICLALYVLEIQLLMQIIVNRIAIIAETHEIVVRVKWGTAGVITAINIAVFCIWIPAHRDPPVSLLYVQINQVWDRISKSLICIVDAYLNWFFLKNVKVRLVQDAGLMKYQPLVDFNTRLMILSVLMDVMLIGFMSLPNQNMYIQFHPVVYMGKLNIEMSMAKLILRLVKTQAPVNEFLDFSGNTLTGSLGARLADDGRHAGGARDPDQSSLALEPWPTTTQPPQARMHSLAVGPTTIV